MLGGLTVDTARMSANLAAARGCRSPSTSRRCWRARWAGRPRTTWWPRPGRARSRLGLPLRDVLLGLPQSAEQLEAAGITAEQIESALDPAGYLGAAGEFVDAALAAHAAWPPTRGTDHHG